MSAPSAVRLRPATPDDARAIASLLDELGHPTTAGDVARRMAERAGAPGHAWVVAESDGAVVGFLETHATPFLFHEGPALRIAALVVAERARRRGIGRRLLEHAEVEARRLGAQVLELTTAARRKDAHAFYRSLGWYEPDALRFLKKLV